MTGIARSRLDSGDADVLANIAEDYYVNGQNQDDIASRYKCYCINHPQVSVT